MSEELKESVILDAMTLDQQTPADKNTVLWDINLSIQMQGDIQKVEVKNHKVVVNIDK